MSRESCDDIARARVASVMFDRIQDRRYGDLYPTAPHDVLVAGVQAAADGCARHLSTGNLGLAHAFARVHAALLASQRRMHARWAAQRAAEEAAQVETPLPDVLVHGRARAA